MENNNRSGSDDRFGEAPTGFRPYKPNLESGDRLGNSYVLVKRLGMGNMGEVWLADEMTVGVNGEEQCLRQVAVKVVPREIQREKGEMQRVIDTFRTIHALQHKHICPVYALEFDARHGHFLVMKYIDGQDLSCYGGTCTDTMSMERLLKLLFPVADALDYAHAEMVVHRDIKPANIMVDETGDVQIIDLGLAAQIHASFTHVSRARMGSSGTPFFMSPEQWDGAVNQDGKTDQFALAVMAYKFLTGRYPFPATNERVLKIQVRDNDVPPIENYPEAIHAVFSKAMAKKREERYPTCREFIKALQDAAEKPHPRTTLDQTGLVAQKSNIIPFLVATFLMGLVLLVFAVFALPSMLTTEQENNSAMVTITPEKVLLTTPSLINATAMGSDKITVSWNAVTNASGYKVEYATANTFADKKTVTSNSTSTILTGLTANTIYHIRVIATGTEMYSDSMPSDTKTVTTQKIALAKPTLGIVPAMGSDTIIVSWNAVTNANGYKVEYATANTFADKKTVTSNSTSTTLTGLTANTIYHIRVIATGTGMYSDSMPSDTKTVTTKKIALATPSLINATATGSDKITVSWNAVTNASGYKVEYATANTFADKKTVTSNSTSTLLTGLTANTAYHIRVIATGTGMYSDSMPVVMTVTTKKIALADAIKNNDMETIQAWIKHDPVESSKTLQSHALSLYNDKKYTEAEKYYKLAIEANPKNAYAHNNYAVLLYEQKKDYEGAEEHYKLAIEIDPKFAKAHNNYANLLYNQKKDYEGAEEHYKLAIEADPKFAKAHNNYAILLYDQKKDYEGAEKHYKLAIEADPKFAKAHHNYANLLYYQKKDYEGAEKHYKLAIEIDPKYAFAHYGYANLLYDQKKDYEGAEKHYKLAIEADPKFALALFYYADFLEKARKDLVQAEEYYKRATEAEPDNEKYAEKYKEISKAKEL